MSRYTVTRADDNDQFYVLRDEQIVVCGPFGESESAERAALDLNFTSPETIRAEVHQAEVEAIWRPLAAQLGWKWSHALGGYINEGHRGRPGPSNGLGWDSYEVADTAQDACFQSGVETLDEALSKLEA